VDIRSVLEIQPEIRTALDRAASFLALASITAVVIAGAATLLAVRLYARQQQDPSAIMRCLGASPRYVLQNFLIQLLAATLLATTLGCFVGVIAQEFLASLASSALEIELPQPSFRPLFTGAVTGLLVAFGFGLSPILSLRRVPVLRLLRRDIDLPPPASYLTTCLALVAIVGVVLWQAQNLVLAFWVIVLLALLIMALAAAGAVLVYAARRFPTRHPGIRYTLTSLGRQPGISILQVVAFGAGIMALLLLTVIRLDLVRNWQSVVPENAPNRFVINIQSDQRLGVEAWLVDTGLRSSGVFPMVRARLDEQRSDGEWQGWNSQQQGDSGAIQRDFNLSFAETLPEHNEMIVGRWWSDDESRGEWSLEEGIAASLGVEVGDTLSFDVGGIEVVGKVANLRRVDWNSFQVNFFVIGKSAMLRGYPATYITSFHLPEEQAKFTGDLVQRFPGITVFDVGAVIAQVRSIIQQVSIAVQYVFSFTLLAGVVVLYAAVQASASERIREAAILRSLGARRRRLWSAQLSEFVLLGAIAGLVAAVFANVAGYALSKNIFELPYDPGLALFVYGILGGAVGVGLAGVLAVRGVLHRPPLQSLQRL
jgi:putative ABC transport system permease protein